MIITSANIFSIVSIASTVIKFAAVKLSIHYLKLPAVPFDSNCCECITTTAWLFSFDFSFHCLIQSSLP